MPLTSAYRPVPLTSFSHWVLVTVMLLASVFSVTIRPHDRFELIGGASILHQPSPGGALSGQVHGEHAEKS